MTRTAFQHRTRFRWRGREKFSQPLSTLKHSAQSWKPAADDRLVIFSERNETLRWLERQLGHDLGLLARQIAILHGQMTDTEQQDLVERFGREDDPIRVLLCSDVASEGLNLHYFCHRLIHFDLPWSLMVFQQRNGRVDRYGQKRQPHIFYLFTETQVNKIKGDYRILEILQRKDNGMDSSSLTASCCAKVEIHTTTS